MFDIALGIFLLLSPVIFFQSSKLTAIWFYQSGYLSNNQSIIQLQFFQYGTIFLFIVSLFQKKIRELKDNYLSIFLLFSFISIFLHPKSISVFINIFFGFLLYKLTIEYAKNIKLLLAPIVMVGILNFIFELLQIFNINLIYQTLGNITGLMKSQSHLGTYQALAIPIFAFFSPYLMAIPILGLLFTKTWTAIISVILVVGYKMRRKINIGSMWIMLSMSIFAILILLYRKQILQELSSRLYIWGKTIRGFTFLGKGLGNFNIPLDTHITEYFDNPYNQYFGIIYAIGVFSIPIFLWLYDLIGEYRYKENKDKLTQYLFVSSMILMVIAFGQSFMNFSRLAGTIIVIFGFLKIKLMEANYG